MNNLNFRNYAIIILIFGIVILSSLLYLDNDPEFNVSESTFIVYQDGLDTISIYGATGLEKMRSTDDHAVIQDALDNLPDSGGTVYLKSGTYRIDSTICFSNGFVTLSGDGPGTAIKIDGSIVPAAVDMCDETQRSRITIRDLGFVNTNPGTGLGINMTHWSISIIDNVGIQDFFEGIILSGNDTHYNIIENSRIDVVGKDGTGIIIKDSAHENTLLRIRIATETGTNGVLVEDAHSNGLYEVDVEFNATVGIDIQGTSHETTVIGAYLEHNVINMRIGPGVEGTTIVGGYFTDSQAPYGGDIVDSGKNTNIIGARISDGGNRRSFTQFNNDNLSSDWLEIKGANVTDIEHFDLSTVITYKISNGNVTVDQSNIRVDTEDSTEIDNLDRVNGLERGEFVIIQSTSSSRDIVIQDTSVNGGNFIMAGGTSFTLNDVTDRWMGIKGERFIHELSRSDN